MDEAIEQRRCRRLSAAARHGTRRRRLPIGRWRRSRKRPARRRCPSCWPAVGDESIGALTFERHAPSPSRDETLQLAEAIAALLGPQVSLQLRANRLVAGRVVDRLGDGYEALFGPRRPALKLGAIGVIALALALLFAKGEHRVTAKSVLEAEVQRAAVAPFDGFVRAAPVRAGDTVRSGDLLAALDDRDLVLDQSEVARRARQAASAASRGARQARPQQPCRPGTADPAGRSRNWHWRRRSSRAPASSLRSTVSSSPAI